MFDLHKTLIRKALLLKRHVRRRLSTPYPMLRSNLPVNQVTKDTIEVERNLSRLESHDCSELICWRVELQIKLGGHKG